MKKISKNNIKFIQGIYACGIYLYDVYYFNVNSSLSGLKECVKNIDNYVKEVDSLNSAVYTLKSNISDAKFNKIIVDLEKRFYLEHSYREVQKFGFYKWFQDNNIAQVKRPDTYGNGGDYTGNNEKLDKFYGNNKLFVKFSSMKEYQEYYDIDNKQEYNDWFEKNKDFFTSVKV